MNIKKVVLKVLYEMFYIKHAKTTAYIVLSKITIKDCRCWYDFKLLNLNYASLRMYTLLQSKCMTDQIQKYQYLNYYAFKGAFTGTCKRTLISSFLMAWHTSRRGWRLQSLSMRIAK